MASTYSPNLAIELIATGEQAGTWSVTTNTNLGTLIEQSISGYVTQAITDGSGANTTITIPDGATGVARNMVIEMTGALTFSTTSLIVPANKKLYFIFNNTTGGFAVTVKVSGQTGVSVPNGKKVVLVSNGTDIVVATNYMASLELGAALPVASGGTSLATLTANNVILGAGTSAPTFVAPSTSGNVLTSNGTTWTSALPVGGGVTTFAGGTTGLTPAGATSGAITLAGTLAVANGGTGNATGTATINANLTGPITSVGNATSITAGAIVNADINASAGIVDTKLATIATASKVSNSATTAASANTASAIVARDASGNFTAGTITAALTGTASGNLVSGGALGTPSSGTLTNCTFPTLNQNTTGTAAGLSTTLAVASGGTGQTTYTNGQLLIGNTTGSTLTKATLTAGANITITNGTGSISIAGNAGTVTSVTGTSPVVSSGGTTPAISMGAASSAVNGYMTGVYATKLDGIATGATANTGTVTSVSGTGTVSGLTLSGTVTTSGSLTLGGAIGTLNQNTTGSSGSCTGNSATATSATSATTASNLTNFTAAISSTPLAADSPATLDAIGYVGSNISLFGQGDGGLYVAGYSTSWYHQIFGDFRTGQIAIRGKNSGTWQAWRTVLDSSNYTSYAPSLTGSGASGTWGINVTGNAAGLSTTLAVASGGTGVTTSTGSGANVLGTSPTLTTPALGTPASADFTTIAATQAQQETGTALTAPVTPGRQKFHPSAAKAWAFVDFSGGTPTLTTSFSISSITDQGVGQIRFNMTTAFSTTYSALLSPSQEGAGTVIAQWESTPNVSYVQTYCVNLSNAITDPGALYMAAFGDQ